MASGILEFLCPVDVVLFIKSCLELNKYHYLLTVLRSFKERRDDRRSVGYTVESLLNGKDIGISCCLLYEFKDRFKRLIRMVNDPVFFSYLLENIKLAYRAVERCRLGRIVGLVAQFRMLALACGC